MNGPKGPQFFVFPEGVPADFQETDIRLQPDYQQADTTEPEESHQPDKSLAEGFHQANINVANLIKANQEMMAKLEAAIYRNGYLEAQLEAERSQVKLLTDSLHKAQAVTSVSEESSSSRSNAAPALSAWQKFCFWLVGQQK